YWLGDAGVDFIAFHAVRMHGIAADTWTGAANGRDGALLEHGQTGADLQDSRRLCAGAECDLWERRKGSNGAARSFQLGRESRLAKAARWLCENGVRAGAGKAAGGS